jgi:hypothetical protein
MTADLSVDADGARAGKRALRATRPEQPDGGADRSLPAVAGRSLTVVPRWAAGARAFAWSGQLGAGTPPDGLLTVDEGARADAPLSAESVAPPAIVDRPQAAPAAGDRAAAPEPAAAEPTASGPTRLPPDGEAVPPGETGTGTPAPAAGPGTATAGPGTPAATAGPSTRLPPGLPLMPAPAMTLSAAEQARIAGVQHRAATASKAAAAAPPAAANVSAARAAVQVPQSESDARAAEQIAAALSVREKPSLEIEELCTRIRDVITSRRPKDEDGVISTVPEAVAREAGQGVAGDTQRNVDATRASYGPLDVTPQGAQVATAPPIEPLPSPAPTADVGAAAAAPDPIPPGQVSLDEDATAMELRAHDAGLDREPAQLVTSGPVADARAAEGDMRTLAETAPQEAIGREQAAVAGANADMAALQATAVAALKEARAGHADNVKVQQVQFKGGEEDCRGKLSDKAKKTYAKAQDQVDTLLRDVQEKARNKWTNGMPPLTRQFNDDLKVVKDQVEERHSGIGGWFVSGWDALTGLPGWVKRAYDAAEKNFGDRVCVLIRDISSDVNTVIKNADGIIATARDDIRDIFSRQLPAEQQGWAADQLKAFEQKLDRLHAKAETTRANFNQELIQKAGDAVQAAHEKVQELRRKAESLWERFEDALDRFLDDPVKFVIDGLLDLVGIPPPAFWAVVNKVKDVIVDIAEHPIRFANNLMTGVGDGFGLFFEHIGRHLLEGLLTWLLSGLEQEGINVEVPHELTVRNVVVFFLELLGISWARIRKILVNELGEKPVALIEKSVRVIDALRTKGLAGIIDDVKAMLDPKTIIDTIISTAIRFVTENLIVAVAKKIVLLLNPVGAILAAIQAIYEALKWVFHNAERIFRFIEAVVNAMADVVAGNVAVVAKKVEDSLAMMIPFVIDFLADYLGLDGLPGKVAEAVKGLQDWIEAGLQAVIKWLVALGGKALAAAGIKGREDQKARDPGQIGESLAFTEGGQTHHLYITVSGSAATIMIASAPMTASAWLDGLRAKVTGSGDSEVPMGASALIELARSQLAATDSAADKAAAAKDNPAAGAGDADARQSGAVDRDEEQLRDTLSKLGELFGEQPILLRRLRLTGGPADLSAVTDELGEEIQGYRGPKILVSRKTGTDYVKKLLRKAGTKASFDAESGTLQLTLTVAAELITAPSGSVLGRLVADDTGVAQVSVSKDESEFMVIGSIDSATTEIAYGLLLQWDDVKSAGADRLEKLADAWTNDAVASRLRDFNPQGKKDYLWPLATFSTKPDAPAAGIDFLADKYRAGQIKARTSAQFKKLLAESEGAFKKAFQSHAGGAAARKTREFALPNVTRERIRNAIQKIMYEHNDRYGLLVVPRVPPEPLPKEVREALIKALRDPAPDLDASDPADLEITLRQADELTRILQGAINAAQGEEAPNRALIESLTKWKTLIIQPEMHHIVPEWLGGREDPDVKLWVPRILHNFGEGPADPGFHQVLNSLLRSRLGFAEPGFGSPATPRINDKKSVRYWLDQSGQNQERLREVLIMAYTSWAGSRAPGLLDIVTAAVAADLKAYEEPKAGDG